MLLGLVDGQDRRPAGGGGDHELPALGLGQIGQGLGKVEEFLQGVGPVDPVLAEQGVIDGVGPGHGLGVGLGGAAALHGAARLEDDHGFVRLPQGVEEVGGPFDPFEIEGDDRVWGSWLKYMSTSASSTSTRLPSDTKPLTPRCSAAAISRKAAPTVPDWDAKAIRPRVVMSGQEAHICSWGILTPWQLGPITRMPVLPDHLGQFVLEALRRRGRPRQNRR